MAEQVIDIRERIEKMRIKFEDDHKSDISDEPNLEKNVSYEEKKSVHNLENKFLIKMCSNGRKTSSFRKWSKIYRKN